MTDFLRLAWHQWRIKVNQRNYSSDSSQWSGIAEESNCFTSPNRHFHWQNQDKTMEQWFMWLGVGEMWQKLNGSRKTWTPLFGGNVLYFKLNSDLCLKSGQHITREIEALNYPNNTPERAQAKWEHFSCPLFSSPVRGISLNCKQPSSIWKKEKWGRNEKRRNKYMKKSKKKEFACNPAYSSSCFIACTFTKIEFASQD